MSMTKVGDIAEKQAPQKPPVRLTPTGGIIPPGSKGGRPKKQRQKPGPKPKITQEVIDKLEYAYTFDCTDEEACMYANISADTLWRYKKRNPQFAERVKQLRQTPVFAMRESVITAGKKDGDLALKYLERKKKDEFSPRQELTGPEGRELQPVSVFDMKPQPPPKPAPKAKPKKKAAKK